MSGPDRLFREVGSFMGVPQRQDVGDAKAAIVGLPFDSGSHPRRVGARMGPAAIRYMSTDMVRRYRPENNGLDPLEELGLVDCGDAAVVHGDTDASLQIMASALSAVIDAGAVPIGLGGDGMVSVPMMEALSARHKNLAVIHFDSHTDAYPEPGGQNAIHLNPATTFAYAAERGFVDPRHSVHVGLRGLSYVPGVFDHAEALGYEIIPIALIEAEGIAAILTRIRERVGTNPVFLCFDMDVFDPSAAPGVFTPAWGGLTAREGLAFIKGLEGLHIVGFDINTMTPGFDVGGQTAWLAATIAVEFCHLLAAKEGIGG
ncbi:MAG: arginase family protein [Pseudomonadota bacterium]